jgi:alcohol-forming fatty acyl-CoA reductase
MNMGRKIVNEKYPVNDILWFPGGSMTRKRWLHQTRAMFYHWLPALIIDFILVCLGIKPM